MTIFTENNVFVIAEMANSHEGELSLALQITQSAAESGAHAIKYQKFYAKELAESSHENYDLYKKLEMKNKEWSELIKFAKEKNLKVFVDIFGLQSAKEIFRKNVDGYKIHSSDISNPKILNFFSRINKPILLSTGGCSSSEIQDAINIVTKIPKEVVLLHGFQGYPTKINDLNLLRIRTLKKQFDYPIGVMDHISGSSSMSLIIPLIAIGLGARIVEKHIILDRSKKGLDYYSALEPHEFKNMMSLIKKTNIAMGSSTLEFSKNEQIYRLNHKKIPVSLQSIKRGTPLNEKMFEFKRTKLKSPLISMYELNNSISKTSISKNDVLTKNKLKTKKKVIAVIACRVHSTRLFAKQLQLVGKYSILELVLSQIKNSKLIDEIVLAISMKNGNEVFIDFAKRHKLKFVLGDDKDVLKRLIDGAKLASSDIVFRITPENPFIYWEAIDALISKHISGNYDFSYVIDLPLGSGFELINLESLEKSHKKGLSKHKSELCTLYINEHQKEFKIYKLVPPKKLQRSDLRLTVDTPQDLLLARIIHDSVGKNLTPIPLQKIIDFLDKHDNLKSINSDIPIGVSRIW